MSIITKEQLLEAGAHFGHQTRSWDPKMKPYISHSRNNIHIVNVEITEKMIDKAYEFIRGVAGSGKPILFVGTKKQATKVIEEEAVRCGQFYVNSRWLGGTLTNFKTIKQSIEKLNKIELREKIGEFNLLPKKEVAELLNIKEKLVKNLGGIKEMREMPGAIFVVDPRTEHIAVLEAKKLNIPVVAICDTNVNPSKVDYIIPANDDATSSIKLIVSAIADGIIEAKEGLDKANEKTAKAEIKEVKLEDLKKGE